MKLHVSELLSELGITNEPQISRVCGKILILAISKLIKQ